MTEGAKVLFGSTKQILKTHRCLIQSRKHVRYLSEFPGDADSPAEAIAADEQRLHGPAGKVSEGKDVKVAQDPLPCYHGTVYSIFLLKFKTKS